MEGFQAGFSKKYGDSPASVGSPLRVTMGPRGPPPPRGSQRPTPAAEQLRQELQSFLPMPRAGTCAEVMADRLRPQHPHAYGCTCEHHAITINNRETTIQRILAPFQSVSIGKAQPFCTCTPWLWTKPENTYQHVTSAHADAIYTICIYEYMQMH